MNEPYVNPDYPVPGTSQFLKPQYNETPDMGFYYNGGGINPFANMMNGYMNPQMMNPNGYTESRRFLPDPQPTLPQVNAQPQNMGLNAFVEMRRQTQPQVPPQQTIPQPPPVSPWAMLNNPPVAPMNNADMFMNPYVDPMSFRPVGTYSDMAHGAICPPINKKMMWGDNAIPNMVYDNPTINWNQITPQQTMYSPQPQAPVGYMQNPYGTPSVFNNNDRPVSWDERAKSIWK